MIQDFEKYEKAHKLLETTSPYEVDPMVLESSGLTRNDLMSVNEGLLGDLFGGWWKKMKTGILKHVPGGVLKNVDKIIKEYEKAKVELMQKALKEKEKAFKAEVQMQSSDDPKFQQIIDRSTEAVKAIKRAGKAKLERFNEQLAQIGEEKSDMVVMYINLKIAEVKERVAMEELKQIEKYATEERVESIKKNIEEETAKREELQKKMEQEAQSKSDDDEMKKNAEPGENWIRVNKKGEEVPVVILKKPDEVQKGEVMVKGASGNEYSALTSSLVRKNDDKKKKKGPTPVDKVPVEDKDPKDLTPDERAERHEKNKKKVNKLSHDDEE